MSTPNKSERQFLTLWSVLYPDLVLEFGYQGWEHHLALVTGEKKRRRHVDFAHLDSRTAIEYQGGVLQSGASGHKGVGALRDAVKAQDLASIGWILIPVCTGQINKQTMHKIKLAIDYRTQHDLPYFQN
jgi:hypothetical protein